MRDKMRNFSDDVFLSIYKNLFNKIARIFVTNDCKQSC